MARAARWKALQGLKAQITALRQPPDARNDPVSEEALALREHWTRADDKERDDLLYYITDRAEQIDITERRPVEEFRSLEDQDSDVSSQKASDFVRLATGKATPVLTYEDRWLAISGYDPSRGSCDT